MFGGDVGDTGSQAVLADGASQTHAVTRGAVGIAVCG